MFMINIDILKERSLRNFDPSENDIIEFIELIERKKDVKFVVDDNLCGKNSNILYWIYKFEIQNMTNVLRVQHNINHGFNSLTVNLQILNVSLSKEYSKIIKSVILLNK